MSDKDLNWKFADDSVVESDALARARQQSHELGIEAIAPSVGAQSAVIAAATGARSILEVGTGAGVSGIWLLTGAPGATLTSIDLEVDHLQHAKANFHEAGIPPNRVRLITGRAAEVLPRMNENSYDIVFVDADPQSVIEYVEHGLRLARPGAPILHPGPTNEGVELTAALASGARSLIERQVSNGVAVRMAVLALLSE